MKRFVKEYANYRKENPPFLDDERNALYYHRICNAVRNCERGFISINEAMDIIANAERYTFEKRSTKGAGTELVKAYLGKEPFNRRSGNGKESLLNGSFLFDCWSGLLVWFGGLLFSRSL